MAVTKVIDIVRRAEKIMQDESAVRWTRLELQDWINDAYKEVTLIRPDANTVTATVNLTTGTRQRIGDASSINLPNALRVIDVIRNMASASTKKAIRLIDRRILDDQLPEWHAADSSVNIQHWMFDMRVPKEFLVYPPAATGTQIEMAYSQVPNSHSLTEGQLDPANANPTTIQLDDIYANTILDYILYRAYSKDAEYAANGQRAALHYQAFRQSLGDKSTVDTAIAPANVTPSTAKTV